MFSGSYFCVLSISPVPRPYSVLINVLSVLYGYQFSIVVDSLTGSAFPTGSQRFRFIIFHGNSNKSERFPSDFYIQFFKNLLVVLLRYLRRWSLNMGAFFYLVCMLHRSVFLKVTSQPITL